MEQCPIDVDLLVRSQWLPKLVTVLERSVGTLGVSSDLTAERKMWREPANYTMSNKTMYPSIPNSFINSCSRFVAIAAWISKSALFFVSQVGG